MNWDYNSKLKRKKTKKNKKKLKQQLINGIGKMVSFNFGKEIEKDLFFSSCYEFEMQKKF